ncbi:MAG: alpha/beta hydrolase [Candidatus Brockarchaeota archaeon]|nr:alpha/beta hydrolase [Candidatus Brockarchaeota archaeon]
MEEIPIFVNVMGGRIHGVMHVPNVTPAPTVVFCHGFTGNRIETHRLFVRAARKMSREGIAAVRFDFRGSGESEGEFEKMTVSSEISDLNGVLSFLLERSEVARDKIGVLGLSLGGAVSILTAVRNQSVKAVCTWSSPAEFRLISDGEKAFGMDLKSILEKGYVDLPSGYRVGRDFFTDVLKHDILDSCSKISPRPLLIIHGSEDAVVPVTHAHMLYDKAGEPKKLVIIEGADHTFSRRDWEDRVIQVTTEWFKETL